jgi:hypothetical protein
VGGSRVHWIVVRDGRVVNRRLGGGAGTGLDYVLGTGPEAAASWFDHQGDTGWWTDDVCSGGALIDADARLLLFFTTAPWAGPAGDRYGYRAAMLEAYARVWPGWRVDWAYDGLADLARYLGEDPSAVRAGMRAKLTGADLTTEPPVSLVMIGPDAYGLVPDDGPPWWMGPDLIDTLRPDRRVESVPMPRSGLHLDPAVRRAGLWSVEPLCGIREAWPRVWPGWELEFWTDRFVNQVSRSGFALPAPDRDGARAELARRVETFVPAEAGLRAMHAALRAGHRSPAALRVMEAARTAAQPIAATKASVIRGA